MNRLLFVGAAGCVALAGATPASACRIPFRPDLASETHDVVAVATVISREDWGEYVYDTGFGVERQSGEISAVSRPRQWTATLRTVVDVKGDAPDVLVISPDADMDPEMRIIGGCWDGIETPQPGVTYAVYLDRDDASLRTTRLIGLEHALNSDPLFGNISPPLRTSPRP